MNCYVCQNQLIAPITLSCGYTVCTRCISLASNGQQAFVCPVKECNKASHLFGPSLSVDQTIQNIISYNFDCSDDQEPTDESTHELMKIAKCSFGNHLIQDPVTSHCGHTACRLCVLQYKILNDNCSICQKRLPGYQYIQKQPVNHLLINFMTLNNLHDNYTNNIISFSNFQPLTVQNRSVYLADFPVLPSQKLRIHITSNQFNDFSSCVFHCIENEILCFGILQKNSRTQSQSRIGTIVKINNIERRNTNLIIDVTGLDRFEVHNVYSTTNDYQTIDFTTKPEAQEDVYPYVRSTIHWIDHSSDDHVSLPPSPSSSVENFKNVSIPPQSPTHVELTYQKHSTAVKLSTQIHDFISDLANSIPSIAFCGTIEGLLGPVWLQSVQNLHGKIPHPDSAVAMCWWSAIVLPVSNIERTQILQIDALEDRLATVLSWIDGLKAQCGNSKKANAHTTTRTVL